MVEGLPTGGILAFEMAFDVGTLVEATASRRVCCLAGPAFSGKSYVLSQWIERERSNAFFFAVDEEHEALFEFVYGLVATLAPVARGARVSFNAMQDRLSPLESPAPRVAAWLRSHLADRSVTIAIDNVDVIASVPQIVDFLDDLVRHAPSVTFIFSGRAFGDLPLHAWMADEIAGLPIFLTEEPAVVPDVLHHLSGAERTFMERLSLFRDLTDAVVHASAGDAGAKTLHSIRSRHSAIFEHRMPLMIRADMRRRLVDGCRGRDPSAFREMVSDIGKALILNHLYEEALTVFQRAGTFDLLEDLLAEHGLRIAESVSGHSIDSALRLIPAGDGKPVICALKAASASRAGRYDVAENLFTEAATLASGELKHQITYAYACDLLRRNRLDAFDVLDPLLADESLEMRRESEIRSALAQSCVMNERPKEALEHVARVMALLDDAGDDAAKALFYTRAAYVYLYATTDLEQTERHATNGLALALATDSYVVAVGALSVLYAVASRRDEPQKALDALQQLADCSVKIGNIDFQSYALMAMLEYHVEARDTAAIADATKMLQTFDLHYEAKVTSDVLLPSQAMQRAWDGSFDRAYDLLLPSLAQQAGDDFRAYREAQLALYAAAAGRVGEASAHVRHVRTALETLDRTNQKVVRAGILATLTSSLMGDRHADHDFTQFESFARTYPRLEAFHRAALDIHLMWAGLKNSSEVESSLRRLESEGAAGIAAMLAQLPMPIAMRERYRKVSACG